MSSEIRVRPAESPNVISWDFDRDAPVLEVMLRGDPPARWWSALNSIFAESKVTYVVEVPPSDPDRLHLTPASLDSTGKALDWLAGVLSKANDLANGAGVDPAERVAKKWFDDLPKPPEDA